MRLSKVATIYNIAELSMQYAPTISKSLSSITVYVNWNMPYITISAAAIKYIILLMLIGVFSIKVATIDNMAETSMQGATIYSKNLFSVIEYVNWSAPYITINIEAIKYIILLLFICFFSQILF